MPGKESIESGDSALAVIKAAPGNGVLRAVAGTRRIGCHVVASRCWMGYRRGLVAGGRRRAVIVLKQRHHQHAFVVGLGRRTRSPIQETQATVASRGTGVRP